jgi:uncharacterized protein DUF1553/uncharacterized protein DUF1549/concanavalin A-like lectin/glucanase superfamily protein/cytochrome c
MVYSIIFKRKQLNFSFVLLCLLISPIGLFQSCSNKEEKYLDATGELKYLPQRVDFNFHIKPILSDRCFTCHGPDANKRKSGLRFDEKESAFAKLETGGHAIVAGWPSRSKLIDRIQSDDPELQMPPKDSKLTVSEYEMALLERWIDEGAEWKQHWSFIPPEKAEIPKNVENDWPKNEIDYFILARMKREGLSPSPEAEKEKLIRRVTFDITGLPPTLDELNNFLSDTSLDAYEKIVDRLFESPRYAERITTEWLDVARYADTHGYQGDTKRRMWPWRDWVIKAFNENMPYDQFVTWQLAGDHLANPTREQLIATGFNRNHMMNGEGGIIDEEFRVEYVADRTNTTAKAFMGLTMECARCHDHKYDPIKQKEYFGLYAFYNNVEELGMTVNDADVYPYILMTEEKDKHILDSLDRLISSQRNDIHSYITTLEQGTEWRKKIGNKKVNLNKGLLAHLPFDKINTNKRFTNLVDKRNPANISEHTELTEGAFKKAVQFNGNNGINLGSIGDFEANQEFSFSVWVKFPEVFPRADIVYNSRVDFKGEKGYRLYIDDDRLSFMMVHAFDNNFIKVSTKETFPFGTWTHVALTYDGLGKARGIEISLNGKQVSLEIIKDNLFKTMKRGGGLGIGGPNFADGAIDEFRAYDRKLTQPEILELANTGQKTDNWFAYYLHNLDQNYKEKKVALRDLLSVRLKTVEHIPEFMVMGDLKDSIRPTYVLNRGAYDDHGEEVSLSTPSAILPFADELPKNRLGLAKWLFDTEHPLTSRVMVNRLWQMMYGKALVSTPDDFGNQGSLPTHPELLDWLAVDFRENLWDIKRILKKMAMSATYRQASQISPEALEKDKYNDYLARAPRYRLSSEMIRDQALAISGLLVEKTGGPSVKPYQPPGLWAEKSSWPDFFYVQNHGDSLYRRSLYTYWRRTTPPPNMITFDSPTRNFCSVKREVTSTPLQALVLLNDTQFVEAARVLAQRVIQEGGKEPSDRLKYAFRLATARFPTEDELVELIELLSASSQEYKDNDVQINQLLRVGEYPVDKNLNRLELASYTIVASAILNLDETITKG